MRNLAITYPFEPIRIISFALALLSGLLLVSAGCHKAPEKYNAAGGRTDPSFVGNEACKPCHAAEFNSHHLSFHDTSMRAADCGELGKYLPSLGVVPLAGYAIEKQGDSLNITRASAGGDVKQKLDLVLGSGKLGMTYISILGDDTLMETRMSYFPPYKVWDLTPGQEVHLATDTPFGRVDPNGAAVMCLTCHASALPAKGKGIEPERKFFGVGCEACHGAGKAHIDVVRAGAYRDLKMQNLGELSPSHLNELCGKCHRNASNVDLDSPEVTLTHRFQPYALLRSACRTGSNEPLSCLYCHDAHANVSTNTKMYEAVCLTCHSTASKTGNSPVPVAGVDVKQGRVCPVNTINGCIGCHMRPKVAFPLTTVPAKMADHLITPPGAQERRAIPRIDVSKNTR